MLGPDFNPIEPFIRAVCSNGRKFSTVAQTVAVPESIYIWQYLITTERNFSKEIEVLSHYSQHPAVYFSKKPKKGHNLYTNILIFVIVNVFPIDQQAVRI